MNYSIILTEDIHQQLCDHLIRSDSQEDLCFATYRPSTGTSRFSGIITAIIYPKNYDRAIHGNVSFHPQYFERALKIAEDRKEGLAFLHSHPYPGWQGMSPDDVVAETRMSPSAFSVTKLPLLGMTIGNDGAWSARFWIRNLRIRRQYNREWCETVRVLGKGLKITFNDYLVPPTFDTKKQLRTISAWGKKTQEDLSRLRIGIIGLGSVGSIVAEILARTGISNFTLIDFDTVEEKNLDRITNVFDSEIGEAKVYAVKRGIERSASSPNVNIECCEYSICEKEGYETALNCDILYSCVDRPWPRQVLNYITYTHLIPVIDGGILVRSNKKNTRIIGADWKAVTVGNMRPCLECIGQYKTENASLEKSGFLDDPDYIQGLENKILDAHENVFVFSSHLASLEVLQMLSLFISPSGCDDVGIQTHHFITGNLDIDKSKTCHVNCLFPTLLGKGDNSDLVVWGSHKAAEAARSLRDKKGM